MFVLIHRLFALPFHARHIEKPTLTRYGANRSRRALELVLGFAFDATQPRNQPSHGEPHGRALRARPIKRLHNFRLILRRRRIRRARHRRRPAPRERRRGLWRPLRARRKRHPSHRRHHRRHRRRRRRRRHRRRRAHITARPRANPRRRRRTRPTPAPDRRCDRAPHRAPYRDDASRSRAPANARARRSMRTASIQALCTARQGPTPRASTCDAPTTPTPTRRRGVHGRVHVYRLPIRHTKTSTGLVVPVAVPRFTTPCDAPSRAVVVAAVVVAVVVVGTHARLARRLRVRQSDRRVVVVVVVVVRRRSSSV